MEREISIEEIYRRYTIGVGLQLHMLRVAGVALCICKNFNGDLQSQDVIAASLLHDMGNILKFNLDLFSELLEPQGKEYWKGVQDDFRRRYGLSSHEATLAIAKEISVSARVHELLEHIGFGQACPVYAGNDIEQKICVYADQRVAPFGVRSLEQRTQEGRNRFLASGRKPAVDTFEQEVSCLREIEQQLFRNCAITPSDITDRVVGEQLEQLGHFKIHCNRE